jgi:hypothetical protein
LNSLLLIRETRTFSGVRVRQESEFRIQDSGVRRAGTLGCRGTGVLGCWGVGMLSNLVCAKLVIWRKEGIEFRGRFWTTGAGPSRRVQVQNLSVDELGEVVSRTPPQRSVGCNGVLPKREEGKSINSPEYPPTKKYFRAIFPSPIHSPLRFQGGALARSENLIQSFSHSRPNFSYQSRH